MRHLPAIALSVLTCALLVAVLVGVALGEAKRATVPPGPPPTSPKTEPAAGQTTKEQQKNSDGIDPLLAIGGIVVSGALGPWLVGVAQRRADRQRFQQDRAAIHRDDLRALLDRAAELLAPGATNLREISQADQLPVELKGWMKETFIMGQRLRLRLRHDHDVVRAYDKVREAMTAVSDLAVDAPGYDPAVTRFEEARAAFLEKGRVELASPVPVDKNA